MPDILLDSLFNLQPKLEPALPSRGVRGRADSGPSFEQHLGQSEQLPFARPTVIDPPAETPSATRRTADRKPERSPSNRDRTDNTATKSRATKKQDGAEEPPQPEPAATTEQPAEQAVHASSDEADSKPEENKDNLLADTSTDATAAAVAASAVVQPLPVNLDISIAVDGSDDAAVQSVLTTAEAKKPTEQPTAEAPAAAKNTGEGAGATFEASIVKAPANNESTTELPPTPPSADSHQAEVTPLAAPPIAEPAPVVTDAAVVKAAQQFVTTSAVAVEAAAKSDIEEVAQVPPEEGRQSAPARTEIANRAVTVTGKKSAANAAEVTTMAPSDESPSLAPLTSLPATISTDSVPTAVADAAKSASPATNEELTGKNAELRTTGSEPRELSPRLGPNKLSAESPIRELNQLERVQLVQRVARAMQTADDDGGTLRLRLSPPELGALRMEVVVSDGVLHAKIEAENPHARAALLENLPALRERLAEQDIRLGRFDVDLSHRPPTDSAPQQFQQDRQPPSNMGRSNLPTQSAVATPTSNSAVGSSDGLLDVTI